MPGERDSAPRTRPVAKIAGASLFGLSAFSVWMMMGAMFSFAFAASDPVLRSLLVILVLVWSLLGPFALSFFLVELGTWLVQRGAFRKALSVARVGVAVDNAVVPLVNLFGMVDSPLAVLNLLNEATAMMFLSRFEEASVKLESAVDKSQGALGWDHNLTQIVVGQLARCLTYLGRFDEAERYFKRATAAKKLVLKNLEETNDKPGQLPVVAGMSMDLYGMGSLAEKRSRLAQAEENYNAAITLIDQYIFEDTEYLANHLNALGELYVKLDRLDEAEQLINRALLIRKAIYGGNHVVPAGSYHTLGYLFLKRRNFVEAKRYLNDSARIKEKHIGTDHPDIAYTYRALGELECALNNYEEAERLLTKSLNVLDNSFGSAYDVLRVLDSLCLLYERSGKIADVEKIKQRAKEIRSKLES